VIDLRNKKEKEKEIKVKINQQTTIVIQKGSYRRMAIALKNIK
jgi:hypothetical protein